MSRDATNFWIERKSVHINYRIMRLEQYFHKILGSENEITVTIILCVVVAAVVVGSAIIIAVMLQTFVVMLMINVPPLRWIALTWQGGLPQVCQSLGRKNPHAF
jgi:hypothetical protein